MRERDNGREERERANIRVYDLILSGSEAKDNISRAYARRRRVHVCVCV